MTMPHWKLNHVFVLLLKKNKDKRKTGLFATVGLHSSQATTIKEHLPWQQKL